jgi:hypothetical protein
MPKDGLALRWTDSMQPLACMLVFFGAGLVA